MRATSHHPDKTNAATNNRATGALKSPIGYPPSQKQVKRVQQAYLANFSYDDIPYLFSIVDEYMGNILRRPQKNLTDKALNRFFIEFCRIAMQDPICREYVKKKGVIRCRKG